MQHLAQRVLHTSSWAVGPNGLWGPAGSIAPLAGKSTVAQGPAPSRPCKQGQRVSSPTLLQLAERHTLLLQHAQQAALLQLGQQAQLLNAAAGRQRSTTVVAGGNASQGRPTHKATASPPHGP